jgi:hypothetical protein
MIYQVIQAICLLLFLIGAGLMCQAMRELWASRNDGMELDKRCRMLTGMGIPITPTLFHKLKQSHQAALNRIESVCMTIEDMVIGIGDDSRCYIVKLSQNASSIYDIVSLDDITDLFRVRALI